MAIPAKDITVRHLLTANNKKYVIQTADEYDKIKDIVGISLIKDTDPDPTDADAEEISDLLRSGKIFKVRISGKTTDGKSIRQQIYCAFDKITQIKNLIGKASGKITKIRRAYLPTRRYLH